MSSNRQRIIDKFVEEGLKQEDVSRATREMFSHYEEIALLYRYLNRKGPIHSTGHLHPEIMVVSDSPEESERIAGFTGFAEYSIYLMIFFQRLGIGINDIFWTTVVKESADKINMSLINNWQPHLYNEIFVTKPTAIIALGTTAITALAGEPIKIDKAIGGEFYFEAHKDIPVIPIKHPRNILEGDDIKGDTKQAWQSIKTIGDLL